MAWHPARRGALESASASASDEIEGWAPAGDLGWELEPPGSSDDEGDLDLFPAEVGSSSAMTVYRKPAATRE